MKKAKIPNTDSIRKLADFWDSHDLTDFADELEEVKETVFQRNAGIKLRLPSRETKEVVKLAKKQGVSPEELVRGWVLQKLKVS